MQTRLPMLDAPVDHRFIDVLALRMRALLQPSAEFGVADQMLGKKR